ncbi:hypothetical protein [Janthinobacterium sp. CG_23.3]|uniref:hypothetical protein n=1 Tax=Janthinobacterium sp. CG_23.3 TaxID=3349634 RepID=UPI0038D3AB65
MPKIKRGAGLSGAQKQFNKLVQLVDQERRHLVQWQQAIAVYERRFADEYQPLQRRYDELQTKLVFALDQAHDGREVGMEDRIGIADVICDATGQLLAERADDALKQLYEKYSGEDYDAEAGAQEAALSTTLLEQFGVDPERASPLEAAAQIATKWRRDALGGQPGRAGEDEQVAASLAAYAARDVPALLAARREIEHLDQVTVNALPDQRLQQYSQVLSEQLAELRDEIENVEIHIQDGVRHCAVSRAGAGAVVGRPGRRPADTGGRSRGARVRPLQVVGTAISAEMDRPAARPDSRAGRRAGDG